MCSVVVYVQIFDKALEEPKYSKLYAQLCHRLCEDVPNFETSSSTSVSFSVDCHFMVLGLKLWRKKGMCEAPASRDGYFITFCEVYIIIVGHCCKAFTVMDRSKNVLYLMCFKAYSTAEKGILSLFVCASYKLLVCMVRPVFVLRYEKLVQLSAFHSIAAFLFSFSELSAAVAQQVSGRVWKQI